MASAEALRELKKILNKPPYKGARVKIIDLRSNESARAIVVTPRFPIAPALHGDRRNVMIDVREGGNGPVTIFRYLAKRVA